MKFEDLNNVEIGDILTCKDLGATFRVTDIDMGASITPIRVDLIFGPDDLTSGSYSGDDFDEDARQWLYTDVEKLRDQILDIDDLIDMDKLITLERLEPLKLGESTEPEEHEAHEEHEALENLTANRAAEIVKGRLIREVLKRVRQAVYGELGTFELKVPDLDLDPVTSDLEWLGYTVRFSMQDDEFTISWEPEL